MSEDHHPYDCCSCVTELRDRIAALEREIEHANAFRQDLTEACQQQRIRAQDAEKDRDADRAAIRVVEAARECERLAKPHHEWKLRHAAHSALVAALAAYDKATP